MRNWTQKAEKKYGWTYAGLDYYIHDTWYAIWKKHGIGTADRSVAPLEWWIKTGRATVPECKLLIEKKPFVIGRILTANEGKDYSEIIEAIKKKIEA